MGFCLTLLPRGQLWSNLLEKLILMMPLKAKASKPSASPKASTRKSLKSAPPESSVQSEDLSRVSKRTKKPLPKKATGQPLTPFAILRNGDDTIDLSNDEDLGDDALEMLIKRKQEAEIFNDMPLFDVDILNNFIDEWFDDQSISIDDLHLPVASHSTEPLLMSWPWLIR